jgi:lipase chaperone LimK
MKSQALQEMVKKIFSDEKTKQQFKRIQMTIISQYKLTEHEKTAVLNTYGRLGLATSNSGQLAATVEPMLIWF